ncbi:MAG: SDR family oxidoreductase [Nitrospinae bacterium]|nr:SDR family oxidoreductase [Nitrospinota bacterium]MDA1109956.1 SDR family oxidoreductase [Nitrospinota bacterium]
MSAKAYTLRMDPENVNYHYCDDLPTKPLPANTRVLVTGANGYVGHRLIPELIFRGYIVRCMFRRKTMPAILVHPRIEVAYADCHDKDELRAALKDVDYAYYLIHSMRGKNKLFRERDKQAAKNFLEAAEENGIKRIIYLGGLGETNERLSSHLKSRMEVGSILSSGTIPVIRLRAAIILGTGSASYELLKSLVSHNRWIPFLTEFDSKCQPIAVRDVIKYLVGVLETDNLTTKAYHIGGKDILSYTELVKRFAKILNKNVRLFEVSWVPLPVGLMCRLYAYWLHLFNSVPVNISYLLLHSLRTDVLCTENDIYKILPFEPLDFNTAVEWALKKEEQSRVFSHWSDVSPERMKDLMPLCEYESANFMIDEHSINISAPPDTVFPLICRVGGKHGWIAANLLWKIRGAVDRMLGGPGLNRGRRDDNQLREGDSVDFWRVEKLEVNKELLLRAEMLSPGLSWLQFSLIPQGTDKTKLTLRAHFIPQPLWGNLYWFLMAKFHDYIFKGMLSYFRNEAVNARRGSLVPKPSHDASTHP